MSKNTKSNPKSNPKSKTKKKDSQSVGHDMWQALFNNPLPNPSPPNTQASGSSQPPQQYAVFPPNPNPSQPNTQASGSSSQQQQYAAFPSIAQPFNLAADDPRNNYQHPGWYQNTQWSPQQPQYHHTQWSPQQPPNFSPSTSNAHFPQTNFTVPRILEESSDEAQPENEPDEEFEAESEPDIETEPAADPKKSKKKGKQPTGEPKRRQLRWLDEEARILAERWIHCSENGVQGRNQTNESFWAQVKAGYNSCVAASRERNLNQLTGKWNKISHDSKTFQGIYKHYKEIQPQSGADENDVLTAARKAFRKQVKRAFIYESSWNVLKHYPKFFAEPGVMANEDTFAPFVTDLDIDDEPVHSALDANMKRLFQDDYIRRPAGRKAAKSTASSSAGSSSRSVRSEKIDTLEAVKQTALAQQEAIKLIKENAMKKAAYKAISFLAKTIGKKPSKKEIKMIKTARQEVVSQYEQQYAAGESEEDEEENEEENANDNDNEESGSE